MFGATERRKCPSAVAETAPRGVVERGVGHGYPGNAPSG
jgi:hypothetical protein